MKRNRILWGVLSGLTVAAVALAGCSGSGGAKYMGEQMAMPAAAPAASSSAAAISEEAGYGEIAYDQMETMASPDMPASSTADHAASPAPDPQQSRKLIKHSNMQLQTKEFDTAISQISQMIEEAGGYIESQEISGRSIYDSSDYNSARSAYVNARIPAERLDEVSGKIGGVCNVLSQSERIEDISEQYFDSQAHLKSLTLQEERLLEILGKAEKLEEVITLESALSNVRYEIETLTASLRRMDSQVRYSYLNLSVNEVVNYQKVNDLPRSFGERMGLALQNSGAQVVRSMQNTAISVVENGPVFLWTLLVWAVVLLAVAKLAQLGLRALGVKNAFTQGRLGKRKKAAVQSAPAVSDAAAREESESLPPDQEK